MKKELCSWGFGLIGIGVVSIVLPEFLDPIWGVILIVMGVLTLVIRQRGMFIVIGIALLMAGIMNIMAGIMNPMGTSLGGWSVFGFFQLYWGAKEICKFWVYAPSEARLEPSEETKDDISELEKTKSKRKRIERADCFDIELKDFVIFPNECVKILAKCGFPKQKAKSITNSPLPIVLMTNVPKKEAGELCEKLKVGFEVDVIPSASEEP